MRTQVISLYAKINIIFSLVGLIAMGLADVVSAGYRSACPAITSYVNCTPVLESVYSKLFGVSLYYYGIALFSAALVLSIIYASSSDAKLRKYIISTLAGGGLALSGVALYLIYTEIFLVGKICEACTIGHASIFIIFIVSVLELKRIRKHRKSR
jgi:uncharacterized membrane protein